MIAPKTAWCRFTNDDERLQYYKQWGLVPKTARTVRPIVYCGSYTDRPVACEVLGYDASFKGSPWAVIDVKGELHCINGELLSEQQPSISSRLLGGVLCSELWRDYVVLDIETTGFCRETDKVIEIAAIRYACGEKSGTYHTMVNPGCSIPREITKLTGITQGDVANAPGFDDIAEAFLSFLGDSPIVGHNAASFDVPFLAYHLRMDIQNPVADTLTIARKTFPGLPSHKLQDLNRMLGLGSTTAHRALADVETTNALLLACMVPEKYTGQIAVAMKTMKEKAKEKPEEPAKKRNPPAGAGKFAKYSADYREVQPTTCINEDSPLCGKGIVFTGELTLSREEAMQMAVNAGAILKGSISKKVDYLVVGKQDITIVGTDGMSGKEEKAHALNNSGRANIKIISEEEFLELVAGNSQKESPETQLSGGDEETDVAQEREAFDLILPHLVDILAEHNLGADAVIFETLKDKSSVYFLNSGSMVFDIRMRKVNWYVSLPEKLRAWLPEDIETTSVASTQSMIRIKLSSPQDVLICRDAIQESLREQISKYRSFGCCGRYVQCSDARRCVHPDPKEAIGCWYKTNLLAGRIFYGKNKNVP